MIPTNNDKQAIERMNRISESQYTHEIDPVTSLLHIEDTAKEAGATTLSQPEYVEKTSQRADIHIIPTGDKSYYEVKWIGRMKRLSEKCWGQELEIIRVEEE